MKGFMAFLLFWLLPFPRHASSFWFPQSDVSYISFYWACKKMAIQWIKDIHLAIDDEYRQQIFEVTRPPGITSINRRYQGELPLVKPDH